MQKESLNAVNLKVVEFLLMTSTALENTEASKATLSKMDSTVSVETKGDIATLVISKTGEFPNVLSDKMLARKY